MKCFFHSADLDGHLVEDQDRFKPGVVVHQLRPPTVIEVEQARLSAPCQAEITERSGPGMRKIPIPIGIDHVWYAIVPEKFDQRDLWRFTQVCLLALSSKQFRVEEQEG